MICIFCRENKKSSDEHIIPQNIGGSTIVRSVCGDCNNKLGSLVDSELNRQRHIYDAFSKIDKKNRPDLEFHFEDAYFEDPQKQKIKLSKTSKKNKIVPTQTGTNSFVIDHDDNQFITGQINKIARKEGISKEIAAQKIKDYINIVVYKYTHIQPITKMSSKTPHRFLCKACVELAHALGISQQIGNFDTLRKHARYGDQLKNIRAFEEISDNRDAQPFHLIQFTEDQFHVHFFLKYATSIELSWKSKPKIAFFAEDLHTRDLRICQSNGDQLEITKNVLDLKVLENYLYQIE